MGHKNFNTKKEIEDQYRQTQQKYAQLAQLLQDQYGKQRERGEGLYNQTKTGYEGYLGETGGLDPSSVANLRGDIGSLRELGRTGGLDEEAIARFRGKGYFDELLKTGGYTDADKTNIRSRASSVIPSMYDAVKNATLTQNAAQGGYSPGYTYQVAKMVRDAGRDATSAVRDSEIGLAESIRSGKLSGATGMSDAEGRLQSLRTGNMFRGLEGASGLERGLAGDIRAGQQYGLEGLSGMRRETAEQENFYLATQLKAMGMSDEQLFRLLQLRGVDRSFWNKLISAGIVAAGTYFGGPAGGAAANKGMAEFNKGSYSDYGDYWPGSPNYA